jgi:hypothetical protein
MADFALFLNCSRVEADPASAIGKKAYFFDTYAHALAAIDDDDPGDATGVYTVYGYDRVSTGKTTDTDLDPYFSSTDKYAKVDPNGEVICTFSESAAFDSYMIIPSSGKGIQPVFIPQEMLISL